MMAKVPVYNMEGETVDEIELPDSIFSAPVNEGLMHQAVVMYLANQRTGTAATKTRAAVRGGGRKPWRQKGLGRARHGSIRSPIWVGGGVTFGPQPREYRQRMNKKARRRALRSALSAKRAEGAITVVDELTFPEPKTREMVRFLNNVGAAAEQPLIVTAGGGDALNIYLSARNIPRAGVTGAADLNTYTVLRHGRIIMTKDAVAAVEEVLA